MDWVKIAPHIRNPETRRALRPGHFTPEEITRGIDWIGCCVHTVPGINCSYVGTSVLISTDFISYVSDQNSC
jgi:hypothetical protein